MRIAILSAGPSLAREWREDYALDYDHVYAINGAITPSRAYDSACCLDEATLSRVLEQCGLVTRILTRPGLITDRIRHLAEPLAAYGAKPVLLDSAGIANDGQSCRYTLPCVLAHISTTYRRESLSCELWGVDCSIDASHPLSRWRGELAWVAYWMRGLGRCKWMGDVRGDWVEWVNNPVGELPK